MSSTLVTELTDQECEKGQLTQRPPIPYATPKTEAIMKASRETFKMKTAEGEVKVAVLVSTSFLYFHNDIVLTLLGDFAKLHSCISP